MSYLDTIDIRSSVQYAHSTRGFILSFYGTPALLFVALGAAFLCHTSSLLNARETVLQSTTSDVDDDDHHYHHHHRRHHYRHCENLTWCIIEKLPAPSGIANRPSEEAKAGTRYLKGISMGRERDANHYQRACKSPREKNGKKHHEQLHARARNRDWS